MSAAAFRDPDSTLIILCDRDLLPVGAPPPPPLHIARSSVAPVKLGIRARTSARESGVIKFDVPSDPTISHFTGPTDECAANDPPPSSASASAALDTSRLPRDPSPSLPGRKSAATSADAMQVVLLVMAIAVLSAVASVLVHLSTAS